MFKLAECEAAELTAEMQRFRYCFSCSKQNTCGFFFFFNIEVLEFRETERGVCVCVCERGWLIEEIDKEDLPGCVVVGVMDL